MVYNLPGVKEDVCWQVADAIGGDNVLTLLKVNLIKVNRTNVPQ